MKSTRSKTIDADWARDLRSIIEGSAPRPEGWKTASEIAEELNLTSRRVRDLLSRLQDDSMRQLFRNNSRRCYVYDWERIKKESGV